MKKIKMFLLLTLLLSSGLTLADNDRILIDTITCQTKLSSNEIVKSVKQSIKGKYKSNGGNLYQLKKPLNINGITVDEIYFSTEGLDYDLVAMNALTDKNTSEIKNAVKLNKKFKNQTLVSNPKENSVQYFARNFDKQKDTLYEFQIFDNRKPGHGDYESSGIKTKKPMSFGCVIQFQE